MNAAVNALAVQLEQYGCGKLFPHRGALKDKPFRQIAQTGANTTNFTDRDRIPGRTYFYRVRAVNAARFSPYSNSAKAKTPEQ